jgi:hypothetical protein
VTKKLSCIYFYFLQNLEWKRIFLSIHHITSGGFNETEENEFTVIPINFDLFLVTIEVIPVANKDRHFLS